jgi:hypothetical protein
VTEDEAYEVLGLPVDAEPDRVDAVHRRLASRAHPDRWLGADLDEQEVVRVRFEEVNEAHRVLKAARKAGLGPSTAPSSPGPRRRVAPMPEPAPAPSVVVVDEATAPAGPAHVTTVLPDVEDDPQHKVPAAAVVAAIVVAAVVILLAGIGLSAPSADSARQRSVLGPLAHRLWEAERTGDHATMWDLAEDAFKARVDRAGFAARLDACPRRRPPRQVATIDKTGKAVWAVQSVDTAGNSGIIFFRQEATYRFGAVLDDPDLLDLLAAPVEAAPQQRWCQRR